MKVLCVILADDYGDPAKGESYEHRYFYRTLDRLYDCELFDFGPYLPTERHGQLQANLLEAAEAIQPDVIFFTLYQNQILPETISKLTERYQTVNWFCDDQFRWPWSIQMAQHFSHVVTTDPMAIDKYEAAGVKPILSQWAAEPSGRKVVPEAVRPVVSFVGMRLPPRNWLINLLKNAGIEVECWGTGWPNGRLSYDEVQRMFRTSAINLNLSNSRCLDARYMLADVQNMADSFRNGKIREQVKGRHFEIAAEGGFQLTNYVDFLENHFDIGTEIACFESPDGLVEKIRYYMARPKLRETIAALGRARVLLDHTWDKRFKAVMGDVSRETLV